MKKVLVVEDTMENIEAAKTFFSTVEGFRFLFATNREQAELLLEEVDALITDRSIPYNEGKVTDADLMPEKKHLSYDSICSNSNGYFLLASMFTSGKPVVMASEHNGLITLTPKKDSGFFFGKMVKFIRDKKRRRILDWEDYHLFYDFSPTFVDHITYTISPMGNNPYGKVFPKTWGLVWEELKEQLY